MALRVVCNYVRFDILGNGLIHIALAKLRVSKATAVADEFVSQTTRYAGEYKVPDGVLQDRAVPDLQNVVQVGLVSTGPRPGERHVTESSGDLGQLLSRHLGV
jgi:hypothetical protein